jgi:hypothetical protein
MGEQSVGKSYALNHLVDTSFAGSAMRTTEGVWMSVTPTKGALIVALDFEGLSIRAALDVALNRTQCAGVHSIERSAQEDTLLVLFNTAISNLVCDNAKHPTFRSHVSSLRFFSATTLLSVVTSRDFSNHSNRVQLF